MASTAHGVLSLYSKALWGPQSHVRGQARASRFSPWVLVQPEKSWNRPCMALGLEAAQTDLPCALSRVRPGKRAQGAPSTLGLSPGAGPGVQAEGGWTEAGGAAVAAALRTAGAEGGGWRPLSPRASREMERTTGSQSKQGA